MLILILVLIEGSFAGVATVFDYVCCYCVFALSVFVCVVVCLFMLPSAVAPPSRRVCPSFRPLFAHVALFLPPGWGLPAGPPHASATAHSAVGLVPFPPSLFPPSLPRSPIVRLGHPAGCLSPVRSLCSRVPWLRPLPADGFALRCRSRPSPPVSPPS